MKIETIEFGPEDSVMLGLIFTENDRTGHPCYSKAYAYWVIDNANRIPGVSIDPEVADRIRKEIEQSSLPDKMTGRDKKTKRFMESAISAGATHGTVVIEIK